MQPGDVVGARFEIIEKAGAGGMGVVFRARDLESGGVAAIKFLHEVAPEYVERFVLEARVLERLEHPGIVAYLSSGESEGLRYLAMEWLEGEDLGVRIDRDGALSLDEAVSVARQVAEILGHAHAHGVVHRDVKPSNIFLQGGDIETVRVLDFGVARLTVEAMHLTKTGALLGTPAYMAPEQIRKSKSVDNRADLFSLGCVLFECLSGELPFPGKNAVAVMTRILFDDPPRITDTHPDAPEVLVKILEQLLEKDRASRPISADAVVSALGTINSPDPEVIELRPKRRAITSMESRLVSIVIAGASYPPTDIDALEELAEDHGAEIEQLIDGSVAAVLTGAAAAHDLCASAARCALALRKRMPTAPMALATGRAVMEATAPLSEVIERAAEMATTKRDGGIALDELTARLLGTRFVITEEPFSLVAEQTTSGARAFLGKSTPFVGRARELLLLSATLEECIDEPEARVVVLVGRAGVGKSRLREEFLGRASDEVAVWSGRGDPMREGASYALLSQVILSLADVKEGEPSAEQRAKLARRVCRTLSGSEAKRITEFLGELCGVRFPSETSVPLEAARQNPQLMADQTRRAFEDFVLAECQDAPVLLLLEDLQWGDLPSLSIVDSALRRAADRPFMVLGAARPEVESRFPHLWKERNAVEVRLRGLSKRASRKLVHEVLGEDAAPALVDKLVEQAAGNAFYLEEILRQVAGGNTNSLPDSVVAMAQSRLEALPEEARRVLRAASVFGETFWSVGLGSLLAEDISEGPVRRSLEMLSQREVIIEQGTSRFGPAAGKEYLFRHSLLRDAAYAMLPDHDRVLGHRLAAQWLEASGETNSLLLAQHLEHGGERRRAGGFYRRAAEEALEANDLGAVLDRAARAASCGVSQREVAELRLLEATALRWRAKYDDAERRATEALRGLPPLGASWYHAIEELAECSLPLGKTHRLGPLGEAVQPPPGQSGAHNEFIVTAATVGMQLYLAGQMREGDAVMERLERVLPQTKNELPPLVVARVEFARATRAMFNGDMGRTLDHAKRAVDAYDDAGDLRNGALMRTNLAYTYMELGTSHLAEETLRASSQAAERIGLPAIAAYAKQNLGLALYRQDRVDEALAVESQALADLEGGHDLRNEGFCLIYLSQIHWRLGDRVAAEASIRRALDVLVEIPPAHAYAEAVFASQLREAGKRADAYERAASAIRALESLGGIDEGEAMVRLEHVLTLLSTGSDGAAWSSLETAHRRLEERATKISDERWRRSFLENVPENRITLELWESRPR